MMENFKFTALTIITIAVVGVLSYWAVITIKPANLVLEQQKVTDLTKENDDLTLQVNDLQNQIQTLQSTQPQTANSAATATQPSTTASSTGSTPSTSTPPTKTATPPTTTYKYQSLIDDLQKLVDANINMKQGSQGTRVGTVQTFLNLYNNTSNKVDNDYGASTKTAVSAFQKAVGVTADGQAGPSTFQKMITWLEKQ